MLIDCIERGFRIRVDVEHSDHHAITNERHNQLRTRRRTARDVSRKRFDVRNELRCLGARCSAANALREGNAQAAVRALIGPNHEHLGGSDAVEAGPIKRVEGVMKLAKQTKTQELAELLCSALRHDPERRIGIVELREAVKRLSRRLQRETWPLVS